MNGTPPCVVDHADHQIQVLFCHLYWFLDHKELHLSYLTSL